MTRIHQLLTLGAVLAVCSVSAATAQTAGSGLFGSFRADPSIPFDISADTLEVIETERVAIFQGSVQATQGAMRLTADELRVQYSSGGDSARRTIESVWAVGNAQFTNGTDRVTGEQARYNLVAETLEITGGAVLERDGSRITGERFFADLATGRSELTGGESGRVRAIFVSPNAAGTE